MAQFSCTKANRDNAKKGTFEILPKGAYVCKIVKADERQNNDGNGSHIEIGFDIAEGEYADFYMKQYKANTKEDKKWPADARYYLAVPGDGSAEWQLQNWDTFWTNIEDSNDGYVFDGEGSKMVGLLFGGLFHNEQSEYEGNIYDHTRLKWTRSAQEVRDNKYGKLPNDKLITSKGPKADSDGFLHFEEGSDGDIQF